MATITNQGTASYQFENGGEIMTVSSNENQLTLNTSTGLTVVKSSSPDTFLPGEIITYTVQITNNSNQFLTGVRIIDNLANNNLAYVLGSGKLTVGTLTYPVAPISTNPLTFTLQQLNVGQTMTLTYDAQVIFNLPSSILTLTNTVEGIGYTSTGTITGFSNNTIQKKTNGDVSLSKSASRTSVFLSQNLDYFLTISNGTANNISSAILRDRLPSNFVVTAVYLRIGGGTNIQLSPSDYSIDGTNLITISSVNGANISVASGSTATATISGYFS